MHNDGDSFATGQTRKQRANQIARFAECQRRKRNWINFADIADWCSREGGSITPDETKRAVALDGLAEDHLAGDFDENGRSRVLFLPLDVRKARLTRDELREVIKHNYDGDRGRSQYLPNCWLARAMAEGFFARRRLGEFPAC
jgi:hypothetical protein